MGLPALSKLGMQIKPRVARRVRVRLANSENPTSRTRRRRRKFSVGSGFFVTAAGHPVPRRRTPKPHFALHADCADKRRWMAKRTCSCSSAVSLAPARLPLWKVGNSITHKRMLHPRRCMYLERTHPARGGVTIAGVMGPGFGLFMAFHVNGIDFSELHIVLQRPHCGQHPGRRSAKSVLRAVEADANPKHPGQSTPYSGRRDAGGVRRRR